MSLDALEFANEQVARPPIRSDQAPWIYFTAVLHEQPYIKIGYSSQARGKRQQQHARGALGMRIKLEEMCEVRGKKADESAIHRYFADLLVPGEKEVFFPKDELIEYIRWLRDQHYVAMPEMTREQRDAMPAVDSSHWLPTPERRKARPRGVLPGLTGIFDLGERVETADDFYTNEIVVEAARRVLGEIDLDPASHAIANRVVRARKFYTVQDDGLQHPWHGRVWLNPPFSQWAAWVHKILSEWNCGRVQEMCVLSAMRTVTAQYFSPLLDECNAMCIMRGRIRFWGDRAGDSPDDGHSVFYFGKDKERFHKEFRELGTVFFNSRL